MEQPQEKTVSIEEYLIILRDRRWYLLIPVFVCWSIIWTVSWLMPASYRSETLILVERQKVPQQYVVSNVSVDLQERLQSMTQQILSRTRLQKIIDDFHLYASDRKSVGPDQIVDKMRKDINIELVQAPDHHELTAFKIAYSAPSPKLAQQVTSELTSLFIDENLQAGQQQAEDTTAFLENQLNDARKNLEEQEEKLRQYKMGYLGELPEQMQSNLEILGGLQSQLQAANQALHQAQQQRTYLDSLAANYKTLSAEASSGNPDAESKIEQLQKLRAQLTELSAKYTDDYPDVKHLKAQIARLEKAAKTTETGSAKTGDAAHPATMAELQAMSPMLQVQSQIKANQMEIENREREVKDLESRVGGYQSRLNMTPLREQQLSDLTRDHQQALDNYKSLLDKEMQSKLATNLEKRQQGEQFRIIDPPSLPARSSSPDRLMFSLAGLGIGLVTGLGLILLVEFIQNRVRSEREFAEMLPVDILSEIPLVKTPNEESRRNVFRWVEIGLAGVMAVAVGLGTLISYYKG